MDEATFQTMADAWLALEAMDDEDLQRLLMPANRMEALQQHMRVKYGEQQVSAWVAECAKRGIVT